MFKKKQKDAVIDLMLGKELVYRVTVNDAYIQCETAAKDWLVRYSIATPEAGFAASLIMSGSLDELTAWVRMQNMMRVELRWVGMSKYRMGRFIDTFQKKCRELDDAAKAGQPKQPDEEILAEEKVLSEKTEESVKELETIKKKKKK